MLRGKKIVVGITGSIAAYKIPFLLRLMIRQEAEVKVIMTPAATDFVTPLTLSTLTRNPVIIDPFIKNSGEWNNHVELGLWADLMLFAPVTANTLAKMAHGQADNFLITAFLSARCPVFIAPAMDMDMYLHPSTQRNIEVLKSDGNFFIEPQTGELASGLSGPGRLEEPDHILETLVDFFANKQDYLGKHLLITAGPTYEKVDAVRFIGNFSSGKMGFTLAEAASKRGASVTLITGPTALTCHSAKIARVDVVSASEMQAKCNQFFPGSDVLIMAAAVSDYTIPEPSPHKFKKTGDTLNLELYPTNDILKELGQKKSKDQILVGFALETGDEMKNANEKMTSKNLDMVILNSLNDTGAGFGSSTNKVTIISRKNNIREGSLKEKQHVANDILDAVAADFFQLKD